MMEEGWGYLQGFQYPGLNCCVPLVNCEETVKHPCYNNGLIRLLFFFYNLTISLLI
jgi:hypothetical protein